jgi:membrane-associated protein
MSSRNRGRRGSCYHVAPLMEFLKDAFHWVTDVEGMIRWGGYVALAIIVFTETGLMVGFFLPGDSLLVTAGLFAARGDLNIVWLNLLLITMAITGDATGYYIGKKLGPALFRRESSRLFKKEHLVRTQLFYEKHGGKTIIIARFVPIIRTFAPVVAGIAQMHYRRFAMFNIVGGIGWVVSMTMIGYLLGRLIPNIDKYIEIVILVVIFLSLVPGFIETWRARSARKRAEADYRSIIDGIVSKLKDVRWDWTPAGVEKIARELELPIRQEIEARSSYRSEDGVHFRIHQAGDTVDSVEITTHLTPDPRALSEAGYQHAQWEYAARFRQAVETAEQHIGPAEYPDDHDAVELARWDVSNGQLTIEHRHEDREQPFRISIIVQP